jgi:hypothetical protein
MPYKVGDMLKYCHPSGQGDDQLELYHFGKDHLHGKLALVLEDSAADNSGTREYFCYIDGDRMWISEDVLREVKDENKKKNS